MGTQYEMGLQIDAALIGRLPPQPPYLSQIKTLRQKNEGEEDNDILLTIKQFYYILYNGNRKMQAGTVKKTS